MEDQALIERELTRSIIGAFFDVYNIMGYGLLESAYAGALTRELAARGHRVAREVRFVIRYKGHPVGVHRLDMVVDEKLVVEIKSTERIPQSVLRQLQSYLKVSRLAVSLLLHLDHLQDSIVRSSANCEARDRPRGAHGTNPF